jgi:TonB family protein
MRRILIASALLSPLFFTAAAVAVASQPTADDAASTPVSTGVKPAHILSSAPVELPILTPDIAAFHQAEIVLSLKVDAAGKPTDVQITKSPTVDLDEPVLAAVRKFRFEPATLDNKPVAIPMTLTLEVTR